MQALLVYDGDDSEEDELNDQSSFNALSADRPLNALESCPNQSETLSCHIDLVYNNNDNVNTAVKKTDFFGLDDTSSEESDTEQPKTKTKKTKHSDVEGLNDHNKISISGVEIELPNTDFWRGTSVELHNQPTGNDYEKPQNYCFNSYSRNGVNQTYSFQRICTNYPTRKRKLVKNDPQSKSSYSPQFINSSLKSETKNRPIYHIHSKISPHLHSGGGSREYRIPSAVRVTLPGHPRVVNRVKWCCPNYSHLLLSASLDGTVKVWNCWSQLEPCVRTLNCHSKAVKDAEWDQSGRAILSCSYDRTAAVIDVETGKLQRRFTGPGYMTCGKFHPVRHNLVIVGSNSRVMCWDIRSDEPPIKTFTHKDRFGQVEDVIVTDDGSQVFGTGDIISRDSSDRTIMAWDFSSSVLLSNQIFQEKYACTRLKLHPTEPSFLAQAHGNYIAIFSTTRPYKLNKYRRFDGHKLMGYSVGCDVSPDGKLVCSGSGDGKLHFYNYHTGKRLRTLDTGWDVALDVAYHPVLHSTVACSSWDGGIAVWT